MEMLQPIANLLGVTVEQLVAIAVVGMLLIIGWYALKIAFKIATRLFNMGCLTILLVAAGLYLYFVLLAR